MSKLELRKAISDLKVNEPYSLKGKKPSFSPPPVDHTNGENYQSSSLPVVSKTTGIKNQSFVKPVVESTSGERKEGLSIPEVALTSGRGESSRGSFIIPHEMFEYVQKTAHSKNELVIFNCLLRYSLGFHRAECEASLSFISEWTGIKDKQNISKTLKRLLAKGLIVKYSEHDSKKLRSSVYTIPIVAEFLGNKKPLVKETTGNKNQSLKQPETTGRNTLQPVVDLTTKKEKLNKNINKTLTPELEVYFEKLPYRKAESEKKALEALQANFTDMEITQAFLWVEKNGVPKTKELVHSPMAFLSTAIREVLQLVTADAEQENQNSIRAEHVLEEKRKRKESELQEEKQWSEALNEFEKVFSSEAERDSKLRELIAKIPFGEKMPSDVARKLAVKKWYSIKN